MNIKLCLFGVYFLILLGSIIGWILNIVHLAHMNFDMSGFFILRIVGIFIPVLGAILGYI
jgi:hypothetical protein